MTYSVVEGYVIESLKRFGRIDRIDRARLFEMASIPLLLRIRGSPVQ